jgi:very-short-patch-repair endonuclease
LREMGAAVDAQVGSAGFRIDLAVRHPQKPERYMLAIECDGAAYHAALWARERDRLRQEILENMGWTFHRIWSTDWYYRRGDELKRLRAALEDAAKEKPKRPPAPKVEAPPSEPAPEPPQPAPAPAAAPSVAPYRCAEFAAPRGVEPHEVAPADMGRIVARIVEEEGPVHHEEVARRVAALFGKERAGARILDAAKKALYFAATGSQTLRNKGDFWFTRAQEEEPPVRDRSQAPASAQKAAMLPPIEIHAAMRTLLRDNGEIERDDLVTGAARTFGFQRAGAELRATLSAAIDDLAKARRIEERDGKVRWIA